MSSTIKAWLTLLLAGALSSMTLTDLAGRRVTVSENPKRIVCTGPGALRLIVYLQAQDRVIAVEKIERDFPIGRPYIVANPQLIKLPVFAKGGPPGQNPLNEEKLLMLNPDVIFATYMDRGAAEHLQSKLKIPVVVLSYGELATFDNEALFRSLKIAGKILGKETRAESLINYIRNTEEELRKRTSHIPEAKKPVVYIGGIGHKGAHGIDSTMARFPVFVLINAKNPADSVRINGWVSVDREEILKWDPDFIFLDEGGLKIILQDAERNPSFYRGVKAVREGRVYGLLPFNYYTTNIEIALADAYFAGKVIYPERFRDISPEKKADEIFKFFVGKPVYQSLKRDYGGFRKIDLIK